MIRGMNLRNTLAKIKDYDEALTMFNEQFVIIPYLASGYIDYSNYGQVNGQRIIDNYETYKRIWTGNDSFTITWKDSVKFYNTEDDLDIKMEFQIGDAILGWLEGYNSNNDIKDDVSFSEYKSQTSEQTFSFRINAGEFNLDTNWEFMFYKVPEISKNILFRVESLERVFVGNTLVCYVLNLKALNQDLASTGRAKQQNVMPNSPGQGYWDCEVLHEFQSTHLVEGVDYKKFYDRWLVPNKTKRYNNPVKKVVIKAFGLCGLSNVAFWGRRARIGGDFKEFGINRWIFPINFQQASTYTLYRTQNEQNNYYWVSTMYPILEFTKEAFDAMKSILNTYTIWPSEGFIEFGSTTSGEITGTNLIENGVYKYSLFGNTTRESNNVVHTPWRFSVVNKSAMDTSMVLGCAATYNANGTKAIHDAMFDAFWTQKNLKVLPISKNNSLNFGWTVGASYAALVAKNFYTAAAMVLIGIGAHWIQKGLRPKLQGFSCMLPAELYNFMISECKNTISFTDVNNPRVKLSYFTNFEQDNEINKLFNTETMNTSFQADLTDVIATTSGTTVYSHVETTCIGQKTYANGSNVMRDGSALLLDGTYRLVEMDSDYGFIIDAIHIQALFQGDYSIEFLDAQGSVVWSGIYQSQGKWTKSVREVNTWINTSIYGRENMFVGKPLPWPKEPEELGINLPNAWSDIEKETIYGVENLYTLNPIPQRCFERLIETQMGVTRKSFGTNGYRYEGTPRKELIKSKRDIGLLSFDFKTVDDFYNMFSTMEFGIVTNFNGIEREFAGAYIYRDGLQKTRHTIDNVEYDVLKYSIRGSWVKFGGWVSDANGFLGRTGFGGPFYQRASFYFSFEIGLNIDVYIYYKNNEFRMLFEYEVDPPEEFWGYFGIVYLGGNTSDPTPSLPTSPNPIGVKIALAFAVAQNQGASFKDAGQPNIFLNGHEWVAYTPGFVPQEYRFKVGLKNFRIRFK